jgi:CheY-like chemotaxis protein
VTMPDAQATHALDATGNSAYAVLVVSTRQELSVALVTALRATIGDSVRVNAATQGDPSLGVLASSPGLVLIVDVQCPDVSALLDVLSQPEHLPHMVFVSSANMESRTSFDVFAEFLMLKQAVLRAHADQGVPGSSPKAVFIGEFGTLLAAVTSRRAALLPNVLRNVAALVDESGLDNVEEILSRIREIDPDLCQDESAREIARMRHYHGSGDDAAKAILADLILDNTNYIADGAPRRKILWLEDKPNARTTCNSPQSLHDVVAKTCSYYLGFEVHLLQEGFSAFFDGLLKPQPACEFLFDCLPLSGLLNSLPLSESLADIDAVVLDLNLTGELPVSGCDFIHPLIRMRPDVPIIVLSKNSGPDAIESVFRLGADYFIPKTQARGLPVYVNRCFEESGSGRSRFMQRSRRRQAVMGIRHKSKSALPDSIGPDELMQAIEAGGAVRISEGVLRPKTYDSGVQIQRISTSFRWHDVLLFVDQIEGLDKQYLAMDAPTDEDAGEAVRALGLDWFDFDPRSYGVLVDSVKWPKWIQWVRQQHEELVDYIFGATSGTLTTSGVLAGVFIAGQNRDQVLTSIIAVAVADSLSDGYSVYCEDKADRSKTGQQALAHAAKTWVLKLGVPTIFFLIPFVAAYHVWQDLHVAVAITLTIAGILIAIIGWERAVVYAETKRSASWKAVTKKIVVSLLIGVGISTVSGVVCWLCSRLFPTP